MFIKSYFQWLEGFCDPFPPPQPGKPPETLTGFVIHYAKPFWPLLLVSAILSTVIALIEVSLFAFVGNLVDWLSTSARETFWQTHRHQLIGVSLVVLIVLPLLKFGYEGVVHQGILGNFRCEPAGRRIAICCARASSFFRMISPGGSPPK